MPRKAQQSTELTEITEITETTIDTNAQVTSNDSIPVNPPIDEFAGDEFIDKEARLPKIQALRGEYDSNHCGYFIPEEDLLRAGWNPDHLGGEKIAYKFQSGEQKPGLMIRNPRMLVCPKSPVLGFDRKATEETKSLLITGIYDIHCREDDNIGNLQFFQVMLLSQDNQPLHQIPLSFRAKGGHQASFSQQWQDFTQQMMFCHALANRIAPKPKNNLFKALCVFTPQVQRQLVGRNKKAECAYVTGYEKPTLANWRSYFVGYEETLKLNTWELLEPQQPLALPSYAMPALTASEAETNLF